MDNKNILIIGLIAGIIVGFTAGQYYSFGGAGADNARVAELEQKIEKAKKFFPTIPDMRTVLGTIEEVKEHSIILKGLPSSHPFEDLPEKREVVVTSATKIVSMTQKDPQVFQKEIEAAQKAQEQQAAGTPPAVSFPTSFIEKELTLKDLKAGDQIVVEAAENIKEKTVFEATRITLQQGILSAVPPPLPAI